MDEIFLSLLVTKFCGKKNSTWYRILFTQQSLDALENAETLRPEFKFKLKCGAGGGGNIWLLTGSNDLNLVLRIALFEDLR